MSSAVRHGTSRGDWNTKAISGQASCGARPSTVTRPVFDVEQAADDPQRGGFAAAGRSQNADEFAAPDVEAQPVVDLLFAERDADILERDDRAEFHMGLWPAAFLSCHHALSASSPHPAGGFLPGWMAPHFLQVRAFSSLKNAS